MCHHRARTFGIPERDPKLMDIMLLAFALLNAQPISLYRLADIDYRSEPNGPDDAAVTGSTNRHSKEISVTRIKIACNKLRHHWIFPLMPHSRE